MPLYLLEKILLGTGVELQQDDQIIEHFGEIIDLFGDDLQAEYGAVLGEQLTVAIEDQTPWRRYRDYFDAVVIGAGLVIVVVNDLHHVRDSTAASGSAG